MNVRTRRLSLLSAITLTVSLSACDFAKVVAGMPAMMSYLDGQGTAVLEHPRPRLLERLLLGFRTDMTRTAFDSLARAYVAAGTLTREEGYRDSTYAYRWPAGLAEAPDSVVEFTLRAAFLGDSLKGIALDYNPHACAIVEFADTALAPAFEDLLIRTLGAPLDELLEDDVFVEQTTREAYWLADSVLVKTRASLRQPGGDYFLDTCAISSGSITLTGVTLEQRTASSVTASMKRGAGAPWKEFFRQKGVIRESKRMYEAWMESLGHSPRQDDSDPEDPPRPQREYLPKVPSRVNEE